ncbi:MAG: hypothetical protein COA38_17940 [Fluviicola sp.]|nr:MAG: hypothetical protein COA38_17940 [Fluviicola sp.]
MKLLWTLGLFMTLSVNSIAQETVAIEKQKEQIVEASCGICQFSMDGNSCDLAIRIDGKSYYVEGAKMDDHGDAHSAHGMCNEIRQAKVIGKVVGDKFIATSFKLIEVKGNGHDHEGHKH